jgi:hypothetical protein
MKKITLLYIACACSLLSSAQEIKMYKTFGGVRYEMDTLVLSPKQVLDVLKDNPVAYEEFKRAKLNYNVAGVLGFAGGLLIGFPIGTAIGGGDPEWGLAAGGVGLLLASIPFNRAYKGRAFGAIELYNKKELTRIKPTFHFYGTQAKLVVRF